jgi:hypothetical protein
MLVLLSRYYYEAEDSKLAGEIVSTIKNLKAAIEKDGRSGRGSRKSRVVAG